MVYFADNNTWQNILKTAACNETNIDQLLILSFKILKSETQTMEFISVKFSADSPTAWKVSKYTFQLYCLLAENRFMFKVNYEKKIRKQTFNYLNLTISVSEQIIQRHS